MSAAPADIRVDATPQPIDIAAALAAAGAHGAVASFMGHVRADDGVTALTLEAHPVMTLAALETLARAATQRWSLAHVTIHHRIGPMRVGDLIVLVIAASPHRADALAAVAYCIDRLKTDVPLWKCETLAGGGRRWVAPRDSDMARAAGWQA